MWKMHFRDASHAEALHGLGTIECLAALEWPAEIWYLAVLG